MKKIIFVLTLLIIGITSKAQFVAYPKWDSDLVNFNSVEMTVKDSKTKEQIFKGYKDAKIKITSVSGRPIQINLNLSGYINIENAEIESTEYKEKDGDITLIYAVKGSVEYAFVTFYYDTILDKLTSITVVATPKLGTNQKVLIFSLKSFSKN